MYSVLAAHSAAVAAGALGAAALTVGYPGDELPGDRRYPTRGKQNGVERPDEDRHAGVHRATE